MSEYLCGVQNLVIDGSPRWEVYRTVPVDAPAGAAEGETTTVGARSEPWRAASAQRKVRNGRPAIDWKGSAMAGALP